MDIIAKIFQKQEFDWWSQINQRFEEPKLKVRIIPSFLASTPMNLNLALISDSGNSGISQNSASWPMKATSHSGLSSSPPLSLKKTNSKQRSSYSQIHARK